jgi:hypothetical protein
MTWLKMSHKSEIGEKKEKEVNINEEELSYFMQWQIL